MLPIKIQEGVPSSLEDYKRLEEAAKRVDTVIDKINTQRHIEVVDIFYGITSLSILIGVLVSYMKLVKLPIRNLIAYLKIEDINQRKAIESILKEMLGAANASRVVVGLFHNGTSVGSVHFQKMSVFYEALGSGVGSIRYLIKDVDIVKLEGELSRASKDYYVKYTVHDTELPASCKQYMNAYNLEQVMARRLESKEGVFGLLEIQWMDKIDNIELVNSPTRINQLDGLFVKLMKCLNYVRRNKKIPYIL